MNGFAPAPHEIDEVLSERWLTAVLQNEYPGVGVGSVRVVESLESTARKVRFAVVYSDDGGHASVPEALCVKGYFNPAFAQYRVTGRHEALFYQRLASEVPIRVPAPLYAGIDVTTQHGVVLMNDVIAQGCTFFDQLDSYDTQTARQPLTELAAMHGQFWDSPLASEQWVASKIRTFPGYIPTDILNQLLQGPRALGFPAGMRDGDRLKSAMNALADRYERKPKTLIHADAHLGNLYRDPQGRLGFVDWQNYEFGHWSLDVAYHLATALSPEVRELHERELVAYYVDKLAEAGGPHLGLEDAWDDYLTGHVYGYFLWAMTRRVEPRITQELTQRLGKSVLAHSSLDLLGV